ncbi:MAG: MFS transporter [Actinomycetota bacterium]
MKDSLKQYLWQSPNFLSIFVFAVFMLAPTSILIDISRSMGATPQDINYVFTLFTIGGIAGRLTAFLYNRRFSNLKIMVGSFLLLGALSIWLFFINTLLILYIVYVISGYLLGVVYLQANKNLMESRIRDKARLANLAISFYPLGAAAGPLISTAIVGRGYNWRYIYLLMIPLVILVIILFILLEPKNNNSKQEKGEATYAREIFKNKKDNFSYTIIVLLVLTYCISEAVVFTWAPTYLRAERFFSPQGAGLAVTVFWFAVIGGRMIISAVTGKFDSYKIMFFISIVGMVSISSMLFFTQKNLIFLFMGLAGLGYSGMFPLLLATGSEMFDRGKGVILTIIFAASSAAKALTPYLVSLAVKSSMFLSFFLASIFMASTVLLLLLLIIYDKKN